MHVAFVTSEMVPYVKTGGLADVSGALPKALVKLGHRVTVVLPRYRQIPFPPGDFAGSVHVPVDAISRSAGFYRTLRDDGVEVVFIEHPPFFDRDVLYGEYADNHLRFAFLARAALEYFRSRADRPDVFHAHDWQTGLMTLGLPWHLGAQAALEFQGNISYLKGGVQFSELVNTVSPTYAHEIQGSEHAFGFEGVLRSRAGDLSGILNGVDYDEWDPSVDPRIAQKYSAQDLGGKKACKTDLLRAFGLPEFPDLPVVGVTSRLVWQKGFDIVAGAWFDLLQRQLRMVVLGTGEASVQEGLRSLEHKAPDRFATRFHYDEALAHKIIAGSDLFLMPSRSEPCGLTQMYALRYGTVPVVRSAGGLVDTVEPWNAGTGEGTGFRFDSPDGTGLMWALDQALLARKDKKGWERLVRNGMARDFSWERSARRYVELYERARLMA